MEKFLTLTFSLSLSLLVTKTIGILLKVEPSCFPQPFTKNGISRLRSYFFFFFY